VKKIIKLSFLLLFLAFLGLIAIYISLKDDLPSVESLREVKWQTPMQIYSSDGKLISQFGEKKRIPLTLDQMPQQLINAILATEDDRFYYHFGVDPVGMGRAILGQLMGKNRGGASTITMQVARNFFLTREQTYLRKIKEIFISFHIEHLLTKDEILTLYMNKIALGHRAYGFGAAAQVYYGKDVNELTLAQIAVLAGLPKAPSTLNPISRPDRAKARRTVVLQRMLVSNYITTEEFEQANKAPITARRHGTEIELNAPYIAEMAHQQVLEKFTKDEAYSNGFKVYTTISSKWQAAAQQAVTENLKDYDQRHGYRGPLKSLRPTVEINTTAKDNQAAVSVKQTPLTQNEILLALQSIENYQNLIPAVVTQVNEKQVSIAVRTEKNTLLSGVIPWHGMAWAREYITDQKQGTPPQNAQQILHYGDVVYVEKIPNEPNGFSAKQNKSTQTVLYKLSQLPAASSALVAISPDNGAIEALVGGFSFKQSQYNRAIQAKRQVGSNIKPFIYSAALDNGFTLATLVNDAPINQWDKSSGVVWRPKNSPPTYVGPIRVRLALARSKNVIAVRLLRKVGLDKVIDYLSLFGFSPDDLPRNESLALGSASLTPLEVATGFATFANGGFLVKPYLIDHIEDAFGNIIYQANPTIACDDCVNKKNDQQLISTPTELNSDLTAQTDNSHTETISSAQPTTSPPLAERVISKQNAFLITEALNSAIWGADWSTKPGWQGTGWRARALKRRDIAGKTGTTNEAKDAWFSGFSRRIVATSWIGFDNPERNLGQTTFNKNLGRDQITGKEFGAKSAQPAWIRFMKVVLNDLPYEPFQQPEGIISVRIDKATGKLTKKTDNSSLFEYFIKGSEPKEYVTRDNSNTIFNSVPNAGEPTREEDIF
jgi:penicillin-binding protein 1A